MQNNHIRSKARYWLHRLRQIGLIRLGTIMIAGSTTMGCSMNNYLERNFETQRIEIESGILIELGIVGTWSDEKIEGKDVRVRGNPYSLQLAFRTSQSEVPIIESVEIKQSTTATHVFSTEISPPEFSDIIEAGWFTRIPDLQLDHIDTEVSVRFRLRGPDDDIREMTVQLRATTDQHRSLALWDRLSSV